MKATIDRAGRIVIPKAIREEAGLQPGVELDIRVDNGVVEITAPAPGGRIVEENGFWFWESAPGTPPLTKEDVNRWIETVRREREEEIMGGAFSESRTRR